MKPRAASRTRRAAARARRGPGARSRRAPIWPAALAVALAAVVVFAGSLGAEFTHDDHAVVIDNPEIRHWGLAELPGVGRSLRTLSLKLDYTLFGESPTGYHAHNLLWHAVCSVLVFALLLRLCGTVLPATLGALLFALHPAHVEAVANVANRKEMLCLAFSLLSFLAYLRALDAAGRARAGWLAGSLLAWVLALYGKQVAVAVPPALVVYELLFVPRERRLLARHPALLVGGGIAAGVGLAFFLRHALQLDDLASIPTLAGYAGEPTWSALALTSARAFWTYLGLLVWPVGLCPDHVVDLSHSLLEPPALLAWLGVAGYLAASGLLARRAPLVAFGLLWIGVHFLPVSNLVPSVYVLADRYLYAPSVGSSAVAVGLGLWLAPRLPRSARRPALAAVALALLGLAGWTLRENAHWRTEEQLWRHVARCEPRSFKAHMNVGGYEKLAGSHARALAHFDRAVALEPDRAVAHFNRGTVLYALGRQGEAGEAFQRAAELGLREARVALQSLDR